MSGSRFVNCPECGAEQPDRGHLVACEECGYAPMPTRDDPDLDLDPEEPEPSFFNGVAPRKSAA